MNLAHIAEGWGKSLGLLEISPENAELARKRVEICVKCPFSQEMWLKKFIDGKLKRDKLGSGIGCTRCGCPINEKVLVEAETCPEKQW